MKSKLEEIKEALKSNNAGGCRAISERWPSRTKSIENVQTEELIAIRVDPNYAELIANAPEWLASLVGEVEGLKKQANSDLAVMRSYQADYENEKRQVEEMQKTLEWYADSGNYFATSLGRVSESDVDSGERARKTLQSLKGESK